ncbi:MAG TPA: ABC transporter permease [Thermofilum sp.]|nr:ABC transporter permease [Thermofilum sp.]
MASYFKYIVERGIIYILSIYISLTIVFIVPRLIPGNPLDAVLQQLANMGASVGAEDLIREYEKIFGLNEDIFTQYVKFLREVLKGNLGYSISRFPSTVSEVLARALPWSIGLLTMTTIISWTLGTVLGAIAGWKGESSAFSKLFGPAALLMYITPYYIFAILLLFAFSYHFRIFPSSGGYTPGAEARLDLKFLVDVAYHSALPALSIVLSSLGWWFLSMRSMMVTVKGEDYILMAFAKGLREKLIIWRYAFRNAILPQVTGLAISLSRVVGGALLTEVIFAYPGIGWVIYDAITSKDYPLIQGGVLVIILAVATANFVIDTLYPLVDPRIRYRSE